MRWTPGACITPTCSPARELYRYSTQLRSLTGGRGLHSEEFIHYQELPAEVEHKVV
ncbi:MAG: hypothetical protein KGJ97_04170, partial [Xanthomonadaceae bacterium]|nr:hypothetical protein [Xanthomonadaceae bacterium]